MSFMRLHLIAFTLLLLPLPVSAAGTPNKSRTIQKDMPASQRATLDKAIRQLLLTQVEAWNKGNLDGFMEGYWHSPDLTFFSSGTVTHGWEPTLLRYRERYKSEGKEMGKLEFQELAIRPLSQTSAVVTGKWRVTMSDGMTPHGLFTLILKRLPEGWRIVHDHTSAE
jgi:beta-aspartyl-peptidase (threonine type)